MFQNVVIHPIFSLSLSFKILAILYDVSFTLVMNIFVLFFKPQIN